VRGYEDVVALDPARLSDWGWGMDDFAPCGCAGQARLLPWLPAAQAAVTGLDPAHLRTIARRDTDRLLKVS
jgi:hypothetical protein